jgi:hypothetical protein
MWSQHLNTLFGTFTYILAFRLTIILEMCCTYASRRITFSIKKLTKLALCNFGEGGGLDNKLGTRSTKHINNKMTTKTSSHMQTRCHPNYNNCNSILQNIPPRTYLHQNSRVLITQRRINMLIKRQSISGSFNFSRCLAKVVQYLVCINFTYCSVKYWRIKWKVIRAYRIIL